MKAIFALFLFAPLLALAADLPPRDSQLKHWSPFSIFNKLLADLKNQVDKVEAKVDQLKQSILQVNDTSKIDPAIIKDLEDIANLIIGLANAGIEIANGILAIIGGSIPSGIMQIIQAGVAIFGDIVHIIEAVIDMIQHLLSHGASGELQKQLQQMATSLKNSENQLQQQIDKLQSHL